MSDDIEVTQEMVEAGLRMYDLYEIPPDAPERLIRAAYIAMEHARRDVQTSDGVP